MIDTTKKNHTVEHLAAVTDWITSNGATDRCWTPHRIVLMAQLLAERDAKAAEELNAERIQKEALRLGLEELTEHVRVFRSLVGQVMAGEYKGAGGHGEWYTPILNDLLALAARDAELRALREELEEWRALAERRGVECAQVRSEHHRLIDENARLMVANDCNAALARSRLDALQTKQPSGNPVEPKEEADG